MPCLACHSTNIQDGGAAAAERSGAGGLHIEKRLNTDGLHEACGLGIRVREAQEGEEKTEAGECVLSGARLGMGNTAHSVCQPQCNFRCVIFERRKTLVYEFDCERSNVSR